MQSEKDVKHMATMIFTGIFVAMTRFCMQYRDMQQLVRIERIRIAIVYVIGMVITFMGGSYIIDWTKTITMHSIVQTIVFVLLFTALFFVMHQIMRFFLPKRLFEEAES